MPSGPWIVLLAWWVYVAEPAAAMNPQTGQVYPTFQWVAKERFLHKDFCESRATEYRRQGQQAVCYFLND